ncbi:hypothetical protein AAFF_G00149150 [Aldrovandia affinis]|uniref:Uncharacterized protein n=1 Tax=Aldrovandia affinis TaxID=143900 RepID=A0AAD7RPI7_9TELE|nr:hypothetical protein AAFF_G00149150 [Aldrovandia affinis]
MRFRCPPPPCLLVRTVMFSGGLLLLLVLQGVTPQFTAAALVVVEGNREDERDAAAPVAVAQLGEGPAGAEGEEPAGAEWEKPGQGHAPTGQHLSVNPRTLVAVLLGALSLPPGEEIGNRGETGPEREERGMAAVVAAMEAEVREEEEEERRKRQRAAEQGRMAEERGYFPNIDLGLQDNEILPPLKGYRLYNQELARTGKKLAWQEEQRKNPPLYNGLNAAAATPNNNFEEVEEEEEEDEEDEEILTREEEESRARAEQEEIRRQVEEAQRNRAEEAKLADIASDMLLQYMVKKQGRGRYAGPRRKAPLGGNAVEDKRSEEEEEEEDGDEDDIDPQTIDKLIEISSKLHLPADDVVDIISDVEQKKRRKKKKDSPEVMPRWRPLMPPPAFMPVSPYPRPHLLKQSPPYLSPYPSPSRKWFKDKVKMKPGKQKYWAKPHKQFLAYPSYQFYQKPYRAYYPIYFPSPRPKPKSRYYAKPSLSLDDLLGNSMDYDFTPPKRRYGPRMRPARPWTPYLSNYILPHPRTYQALPVPKPRSAPRPRPPFHYLPAAMATREDDSYERAGQQDSDEELENFMEKVYMRRRMYK